MKARILVVDHDAAAGRLISSILEAAGYEVVLSSESEAAALVRECAVDLVVSDIILGGRDGHDVADELRTIQPGVTIVFMSGYGASRYGSIPSDPVLTKPIDAGHLLARIKHELTER